MIIDMHGHLRSGQFRGDREIVLKAMERYGIDRIYISVLATDNLHPDEESVDLHNREAAAFMREQPDRVRGYVFVNPCNTNAVDVLRRGIEDAGMEGAKVWLCCYCDDPIIFPVVEKLIDYNLPLLIHCFHKTVGQMPNESVGENVANLARRYPEAKLIMAHLGGNCYNGIPAIQDCPNVWVDYSGSSFRADELRYTIDRIGAERVLFGTDLPVTCLTCIGPTLDGSLTQDEREKLFSGNALRLFCREKQEVG